MTCPHTQTRASTKLIDGETVLQCLNPQCRQFCVAGEGTWIRGGAGLIESLRRLAGHRDADKAAVDAILDTDIDDVRWEVLA